MNKVFKQVLIIMRLFSFGKRSCLALTTYLLVGVSATAYAGEGMDTLNKFVKQLKTLDASFVQTLVDSNGKQLQRQSGVVVLQKPGRFKWHYQAPEGYEQFIVADGEKLWFYDVDLEEVTVKSLDEALGSAPIALLTSDTPLTDQFKITELGKIGEHEMLQLESKVQDTDYGQALLAFDDKGVLAIMQLKDPLGQVTNIEFSDTRMNSEIAPSEFVFEVPDGVYVTGQQ